MWAIFLMVFLSKKVLVFLIVGVIKLEPSFINNSVLIFIDTYRQKRSYLDFHTLNILQQQTLNLHINLNNFK